MNIGMTKAIATQAAKDEIAKVGTGVDNVARTGVQEVKSQLEDLANKGTTVEVLERVTKEEIDRQIADGTIANLTIEDGSITSEKIKTSYTERVLYDATKVISGGRFLQGIWVESVNFSSTDFIKVFEGEEFKKNQNEGWEINFWDINKKFIKQVQVTGGVWSITPNENISYMTIPILNMQPSEFKLELTLNGQYPKKVIDNIGISANEIINVYSCDSSVISLLKDEIIYNYDYSYTPSMLLEVKDGKEISKFYNHNFIWKSVGLDNVVCDIGRSTDTLDLNGITNIEIEGNFIINSFIPIDKQLTQQNVPNRNFIVRSSEDITPYEGFGIFINGDTNEVVFEFNDYKTNALKFPISDFPFGNINYFSMIYDGTNMYVKVNETTKSVKVDKYTFTKCSIMSINHQYYNNQIRCCSDVDLLYLAVRGF